MRRPFALLLLVAALPVGASPLHDAIWSGEPKKVSAVLRTKPDVNGRNDSGFTPLCYATSHDDRKAKIVELLIHAGADVNLACGGREETPLHLAADSGDAASVKLLLAAGARVNARNFQDSTPLYVAADGSSPEVVALLLKAGAEIDARGVGGNTPLLNAMSNGSGQPARTITELLLAAGADPNASGGYGTPLTAAVSWGRSLLIQPLLDAGADPRLRSDYAGSALEVAREAGNAELVTLFESAKPAAQRKLAPAAEKLTPDQARTQLLKLGFERTDGDFLLDRIDSRDKRAVQLLLAAGTTPKAMDQFGRTAMKLAIDSEDRELVQWLLDAGADPNDPGKMVVQGAELREAPIVSAVASGNAEITQLLLERGAKPDTKTISGRNALMIAALAGRDDLVRLLVEARADVNVEDRTGVPVLWNAVQSRNPAVVKLLLVAGARVGTHRKVLADAAKESGNEELVSLIRAAK
jgi:ankyrin repeat protein